MTVSFGFYDSVGGDRVYNATQFSAMMDGIIQDGIFATVGDAFFVALNPALGGLNLLVGSGRGWFDHTWIYNDGDLPLVLDPAPISQSRIDYVVIETNSTLGVRANSIKIITGTPAVNPVSPTLVRTTTINQYPLARILLTPNQTVLSGSEITSFTGSWETPFVTGLFTTIDITSMVAQWEYQFTTWFDGVVTQVSELDVIRLQEQIDLLDATVTTLQSELNTTNTTITGIQADIATLQTALNTANATITGIQSDLDSMTTSMVALDERMLTIESNPMLGKEWGVTLVIDNGDSVITTGTKITTEVPFYGSILDWKLTSGDLTSGSISLILETITYANFSGGTWTTIGTVSLSAAVKNTGTFTSKLMAKGDIMRIRIASAPTSIKKVSLSLRGLRTTL